MMALDLYKVTFSAPGITAVPVLLDSTPPTIPSGYGGWTVVNRERRIGLTVWDGKDPIRMSVPVLFDGVREGISQEVLISRLSRMALPPSTGGEPPIVKISGKGLPNPGPVQWVIENLQWGTNIIRDFANNGVMARLRQDCVVNLLEYRADDVASFKGLMPGKVASTSGSSKTGWPKNYVVKTGDTLSKVAARFYGDPTKWRDIAKANSIRDPASPPVGKTIRIPAP